MIPWIAMILYGLALMLLMFCDSKRKAFCLFTASSLCWAYWAGFGVGSELLFVAHGTLTAIALFGALTEGE